MMVHEYVFREPPFPQQGEAAHTSNGPAQQAAGSGGPLHT
jgi:hypothetical protein